MKTDNLTYEESLALAEVLTEIEENEKKLTQKKEMLCVGVEKKTMGKGDGR